MWSRKNKSRSCILSRRSVFALGSIYKIFVECLKMPWKCQQWSQLLKTIVSEWAKLVIPLLGFHFFVRNRSLFPKAPQQAQTSQGSLAQSATDSFHWHASSALGLSEFIISMAKYLGILRFQFLYFPPANYEKRKGVVSTFIKPPQTLILVWAALKSHWRNEHSLWLEKDFFIRRADKNSRIRPLLPPPSVHYTWSCISPACLGESQHRKEVS